MKTGFKTLLFITVILACHSVFAAVKIMYKWTDEKGEVHYTERAPKGIEYTRITTHVDADNAAATRVPTPKTPAIKDDKKSSYGTWRQENCTIATQNLEMLNTASRIGVDDGQGGKRLMSDEEKAKQIAQMQEQIEKYCKKAE
jgi:hypothetical protein